MYRKLCCIFAAVAMLFCLAMGVQAAEASFAAGASYYQLQNDEDGITIDHDMLLDLNGHHVTNASVAEGVTLRLMDSANDGYDASKCGSFSGTIDGTVEQLVKTTADEVGEVKSYLVINEEGVYSAHRYYAGITKISLAPNQVALGYKAEYYADEVINAMITGYGYGLWINDLNPVQRIQEGKIADHELTLRLKNILSDNEALSQIGASATINGNAVICFEVDGQEVTVTGADHNTTLQAAVEAVNTSLGQDRSAYTKDQIQSVRDLINKFNSYMNTWAQEYIFTEDKFAPVENASAIYGESLTLGQVFTAVEGVTIGENVTATVNGEAISVDANWADTALNLNAGEAVITITDNDLCWTATNTVAVGKADPTYTVPTGLTATYGQTLNDVALTDNWTWKDSSESVGDAGTNSFTAVYTPADTANYNTVEVEISVVVAKADPSCTIPTDLTATYGDTLADVDLPSGFAWKDSSASVGNVGTNSFAAVYTPADTANYNTVEVQISVMVAEPPSVDKFAISLYEGEPAFLYRVGNSDAVKLGSLFKALDGAQIGNVTVTVAALDAASNVSGTYTANSTDWTAGTLKFTGTGPVTVTIDDDDYANALTMNLEVVTGYNVTQYSELQNRSSVLLNDITMSSGSAYSLTGGKTLYGNGFTFDVTDGAYNGTGYITENGLIYLNSSNLDNVQIIGAVYTAYGATSSADYNRSTVSVQGNCTIANCYISNCASPIRVHDGNVEIINTTLKGGNYANLDIRNGNVVLDNVTTINQVKDNDLGANDTVVCGLGIVFHYEQVLATTTLEIRNGLTQYNYFSETQANTYMLDAKASALTKTMFKSDYAALQYTDADGEVWVNAGIISMCETIDDDNITDVDGYISMSATLTGTTGFVHSCKPTAEAIAAEIPAYASAGQYAISPSYSFDYTTKNYAEKTEGSNYYCYYSNGVVMLSMDEGDSFDWDTSILTATKNGQTLPYTVTMNGTDYSGKKITFNTAGNYTVTYTYTDSNNYGLDASGNVTTYNKSYTKTVRIQVAVVKPDAKNAEFTFGSNNVASTTVTIGNDTYVMPNVTATSDTIGSKSVSGTTVYMPIINCAASNNKTSQTSGTTWYMLFPVFKNVVTIVDYADSGTGAAVTYNSSTTTLPSGLAAVNPATTFQYASATEAPSTPSVYSSVLYYTSPAMEGVDRASYTIDAKYQYTDNAGTTYYYYVRYITPKITNTGCVTGDTLVTLADGTQKEIQYVTYSDQLLVWDFYKGEYAAVPSAIIFDHGYGNNTVIKLKFSDGTSVNVVNLHQFMDATENRFVTVDAQSVARYVGHEFVKQDGDGYKTVTLTEYAISQEYVEAYGIITAGYYNLMVNGMWSTDFMHEDYDLFNYFAIGENMMFDQDAMAADIAAYGLYTYEDFADYLTYEQFVGFNVQFFKISVGKGLYTYEGILNLIETYLNA